MMEQETAEMENGGTKEINWNGMNPQDMNRQDANRKDANRKDINRIDRIDLHVHSMFSKRPSQWVLQKLGCPESFTEPLQVYRIAKARGMTFVTITDHNSIAGALEIAHLPDTFVSEEITTYFPEDGCKVHVLAYRIDEAQHKAIQKVRSSIYDLVDYLNNEGIPHAVAHPLYGVNDRLTMAHFEKMLLLFRHFELNGARDERLNRTLRRVLSRIDPRRIMELADRHDLAPRHETPWRKHVIGGSDDHSGLNIARTHVRLVNAGDVDGLLAGIAAGEAEVMAQQASPLTMAHNLYGIAYQYYRNRFNLGRCAQRDVMMRFLDRSLCPARAEEEAGLLSRLYFFLNHRRTPKPETDLSGGLLALLRDESRRLLLDNPDLFSADGQRDVADPAAREARWFDFVNQVTNKAMHGFGNHLLGHLAGANVFDIFQTIGSAGGLYTLLAPYFVAYSQFNKDHVFNMDVCRHFAGDPREAGAEDGETAGRGGQEVRVAHFTDTFHDVNGVARTLQQQARLAFKTGKPLTVITCDPVGQSGEGVRHFAPAGICELPEYPEIKLCYPPFLEMLRYCHDAGFTHIHSATPGPVGLAALAIARILKLPIYGTYHTALPQYAEYLTGDPAIADLTWKFTIWYYQQMDSVHVPSRATGDELIEKGIRPEKIRMMSRGINVARFHPSRRNGIMRSAYGIPDHEIKLLYVGRVSREKNLNHLTEAFNALWPRVPNLRLVVVGDGPYLSEMKTALADAPATFTGYLAGDALTEVFASCDLFVFPSTTDTFGNVVLEAQASGLPVIVTDAGGPAENMIPGKTGLVIRGDCAESLERAIGKLALEPGLRRRMGIAARAYMENRSFEDAFVKTWEMYGGGTVADPDGDMDGIADGIMDGIADGVMDGIEDGVMNGIKDGIEDGGVDGVGSGAVVDEWPPADRSREGRPLAEAV